VCAPHGPGGAAHSSPCPETDGGAPGSLQGQHVSGVSECSLGACLLHQPLGGGFERGDGRVLAAGLALGDGARGGGPVVGHMG
jgi:hypothetical protein